MTSKSLVYDVVGVRGDSPAGGDGSEPFVHACADRLLRAAPGSPRRSRVLREGPGTTPG